MLVGIIGLGFVGNAINSYFNTELIYDKYKNGGIGSFDTCMQSDILFLCLPTLYKKDLKRYDIESLIEILERINQNSYKGIVVIKSTIEPKTTQMFADTYPSLKLLHNPEFLCAKTAVEDYKTQKKIILGYSKNLLDIDKANTLTFFKTSFPLSEIIECSSDESECIKIFCNSFYAAKIQIFNEFYDLCEKQNIEFENVRKGMLFLDWINPMHTNVPGSDGQKSFGGACFPKDISALTSYMERNNIYNSVLKEALNERNMMREYSDS